VAREGSAARPPGRELELAHRQPSFPGQKRGQLKKLKKLKMIFTMGNVAAASSRSRISGTMQSVRGPSKFRVLKSKFCISKSNFCICDGKNAELRCRPLK
jgi:hypothetical protein